MQTQTISGKSLNDVSGDPALSNAVAQYRHAIFVDRLGWKLPTAQAEFERDQFDTPQAIYVVSRNEKTGNINGCARLLPTTVPYLTGEVFPHLFNGLPIPCSPEVYEISRFASADLETPFPQRTKSDDVYHARALFAVTVETAMKHGAERLIMVTTPAVERLLIRVGAHVHRVGPSVLCDGKPIVAVWVETDEKTLRAFDLMHLHKHPNLNA